MPAAWLAALALAAPAQGEPQAPPLRLVVMVAVDQMVPDQLTRLEPWLDGGLGRFARQGLVFAEAALQHGDTETAPGHTVYGTGRNPTHNGIVSNDWYPLDSKQSAYCYADAGVKTVDAAGARDGGSSPRNNRALGFVDFVKAARPGAKAVSISSKDRAAIGMSGQHPDLALWWSKRIGGFQTSSWYASELPPWVRAFDAGWLARFDALPFAKAWRAELPNDFSRSGTAPDEREGEVGRGAQRAFPHPAPQHDAAPSDKELAALASWVYDGPAGDVFVCDMAGAAVDAMELGRDDVVDVLCVSLSSCDTVGHGYGPRSVEVTDVVLRADRELGKLFAHLDAKVGAGRWIASLSADHGVLELPETLAQRGLPSERISGRAVGDSIKGARARVAEKHGGQDFYLASNSRGLRLSLSAMKTAGVEPKDVRSEYAAALRELGAAWLEHALTFDELEAIARKGAAAQGLVRMEANSFDEERTCDVVILCKPWCVVGLSAGTTHGTPYPYDRAVPLAFYGPGFAHATSFEPAASIDAVPTLLARLGVPLPEGLDGRDLLATR